MKYISFTINKYKAISTPVTIDIDKERLIPIIGVNECGKTTILKAVLAFDYYNDTFDDMYHHLQDTGNLYDAGEQDSSSITARIAISSEELKRAIKGAGQEAPEDKSRAYTVRLKDENITEILITRSLGQDGKSYNINFEKFDDTVFNNLLAKQIIRKLPYILYFDDFRDHVPEKIDIDMGKKDSPSGWLAIVERLFKESDSKFSIFDLEEKDDRVRKTILAKVNRKLQSTLAKEWQTFKLDDSDSLNVAIDFMPSSNNSDGSAKPAYVKFEIVETDNNDELHYFYVRDRSKGFYWFFNFVMKLEFNPKIVSNEGSNAIYLLDEPGSYLHATAQSRLCKKLEKISKNNSVIYCTHSHYLLDPDVISIKSIKIASKNDKKEIHLSNVYNYTGKDTSAFQPIYDTLEVKPFGLKYDISDKVVLVEGIYDYYCFSMFLPDYRFIPCKNAESISYYISLMIGWGVKFNALWDNDPEGIKCKDNAVLTFKESVHDRLHLLPSKSGKKTILQNMFIGTDLVMIRQELGIPHNASFDKTIYSLYYSNRRKEIVSKVSEETKKLFFEVEKVLNF
jgi:hypothetical protein